MADEIAIVERQSKYGYHNKSDICPHTAEAGLRSNAVNTFYSTQTSK